MLLEAFDSVTGKMKGEGMNAISQVTSAMSGSEVIPKPPRRDR